MKQFDRLDWAAKFNLKLAKLAIFGAKTNWSWVQLSPRLFCANIKKFQDCWIGFRVDFLRKTLRKMCFVKRFRLVWRIEFNLLRLQIAWTGKSLFKEFEKNVCIWRNNAWIGWRKNCPSPMSDFKILMGLKTIDLFFFVCRDRGKFARDPHRRCVIVSAF